MNRLRWFLAPVLPFFWSYAPLSKILYTQNNKRHRFNHFKTIFMSKIHEIIVAALIPTIKTVGKIEMENVLSGIKEHNSPEIYKNTLQGLYSNFLLLKDVAYKTTSKIDDGIVDLVLESVKESADSNGIVLN